MEEEKHGAARDGGTSPIAAQARTHAAAQNGEQSEEAETKKAGLVRRHSIEPSKTEGGGGWKGAAPQEEPLRKRFQIPRKTKKGGAALFHYPSVGPRPPLHAARR